MDTLFDRKLGTMTNFPSGVNDGMNGRVWTFASLVPTSTRATSAFGDAAAARSTSMNEIVLPSKATCDASACEFARADASVALSEDAAGRSMQGVCPASLIRRTLGGLIP